MQMQGPLAPDLIESLRSEAAGFDLVIFVTYLYYTTYHGLPAASTRAVLHPTAHDEPPMRLAMFDGMFKLPKAFAFLTDEERAIVQGRFELPPVPQAVVGIGVGPPPIRIEPRRRANPYVVCLGRVDAMKGVDHLVKFFRRYRSRTERPVDLVLVGDNVAEIADQPGITVAGIVDEREKWELLAGASALIHPSYFESFAINLLEGWCVGTPAVVNGYCDVTVGHCRRSSAGLWYRSYPEFEACLDRVIGDEQLASALAANGAGYVRSQFDWDVIVSRYIDFLRMVRETTPP